jgi:1,4-alpha-glucan branching enzyme
MEKGYLALILHAHLPFVRHPEYDRFLEENWLYEAISETYLPLLRVFNRLAREKIPYRITMSISPTLASMLRDELLQERYIKHVEHLIDLGNKELVRTEGKPEHALASMYKELFERNFVDFTSKYRRNILKGFKELQRGGHLDLITTAATHSYLPLYQEYPENINMQIQTAVINHGRILGSAPKGLWIPECGYYPGLEKYVKVNNLPYFISAAHGVLLAEEKPKYGVYAPITCSNGVAVFARDLASSHAVWSSEEGYPGDFSYREFYRDIGYDLPLEYIGPYIHDGGIRINTGYKYYKITGKTNEKLIYSKEEAERKVEEHAENFLYNRLKQVKKLNRLMDRPPIIVSPYDAELFGHWWFEGPRWIEHVIRMLHTEGKQLEMITPGDYLDRHGVNQQTAPSFSSWGTKGYSEVWLNGTNDWIYRHTHTAIERMRELAQRFPDESGLKERVLNQAAREVLLSQASDWPFIMKTGTTVPYATKRVREHICNFNLIYENLCKNTVNTEWLTKVEKKNNIFPDIDYRSFAL